MSYGAHNEAQKVAGLKNRLLAEQSNLRRLAHKLAVQMQNNPDSAYTIKLQTLVLKAKEAVKETKEGYEKALAELEENHE